MMTEPDETCPTCGRSSDATAVVAVAETVTVVAVVDEAPADRPKRRKKNYIRTMGRVLPLNDEDND